MTVHGGDVWEQGVPVSEILDFSANINPRGLPAAAQERLIRDAADSRLLGFYPDPSARALRNAISQYIDCPPESIVIGPGAESLLAPIFRHLGCKRALIPVPAFSEYRRVCAQENVELVPFPLRRSDGFRMNAHNYVESILGCDLALVNNPHNPTGVLLTASILEAGVSMIVDEAFIDYAAGASRVREAAARRGLIVVRSLTKFFGCPALRVGYAVAHPETIQGIRELLPTWPVTQLALDALGEAVLDKEYARVSLKENEAERGWLSERLGQLGLEVFPSAANYLFIELGAQMASSSELRLRLMAGHKILIRNCDSYEGLERGRYIRVAVRSRPDNERLVEALRHEGIGLD
jgi:threonine-phosphate decarboxylase